MIHNNKKKNLTPTFETHFTINTIFSILCYNIITSNHPNYIAHVGAAILIKSSFLFTPYLSIQ